MDGNEALAVAALLQFSDVLQFNLKVAFKEDSDWYNRFMPLTKMIMELVINQSLVKSILQVIDEDGSVKDSASSNLKRSRDQVRMLERKLYQLMDSLVRNGQNETSSLEVSNINGRWCLKSGVDQLTNVNGLLLSSGSDLGSLIEPLSAIPLNDELQQARSLVAKAEEDVLLRLTEKMQRDLDDINNSLNTIIELDMVTARAKYSLSFGGTLPDLFLAEDKDEYFTAEVHPSGNKIFKDSLSHSTQREWTLYLPKAYHPLLLQQHRQNLKKARKDVSDAIAEIRRRRLYGENKSLKDNPAEHLASMEMKVSKLEEAHPVPVDFFVGKRTRVLVITGPNTGGKTICLKTVGLAAMMAKSGLYVLSSEPVRIPWFDSVFADIGDEQSLSQSLSTFSGHLRRISVIEMLSISLNIVEVGAGTNPLEGAALGMSLLESFAEAGAFLTIATTHHGELKTLKYSNDAFENACMEFDEVNLKPTYKILWGIPGRSNAINIAERLGLPNIIVDNARELYGTASAEIDRVIFDMEQFKQEFRDHTHETQQYLSLSKELHENLLVAKQKITEHGTAQRYRKMKEVSEAAAMARSLIHKKLREFRASATQHPQSTPLTKTQHAAADDKQHTTENIKHPRSDKSAHSVEGIKQLKSEKQAQLPKVGDVVHISSLGKKATVLKVEASKQEIIVQASNMKKAMLMRCARSTLEGTLCWTSTPPKNTESLTLKEPSAALLMLGCELTRLFSRKGVIRDHPEENWRRLKWWQLVSIFSPLLIYGLVEG
ncbi:DNA mismatch repair protein MutS [Macleaya cordata]|uniref:DNA mismatch repair protein MutS n=1 Tax=Macleaya cordata TaxID=56857 RepID=A0A200R035_MACCD|nr:DNA mismatch repair protein MutS [Macleaya cordata]